MMEKKKWCVCAFIPSPVWVSTLLMEVPGTPNGASFFGFELKTTMKVSADPTQHEIMIILNPNPNQTGGIAISPETNLRWTSDQSVNSNLSVVVQ